MVDVMEGYYQPLSEFRDLLVSREVDQVGPMETPLYNLTRYLVLPYFGLLFAPRLGPILVFS